MTFILFIRSLKFFVCLRLSFPANVVISAPATNTAVDPAATAADTSIAVCAAPADAFPINAAVPAAALTEELPTKTLSPAAAPTAGSVEAPAVPAARLRARCT